MAGRMIAGVKRAAVLAMVLIGQAYYWRERANALAGDLAAAEAEVTAPNSAAWKPKPPAGRASNIT